MEPRPTPAAANPAAAQASLRAQLLRLGLLEPAAEAGPAPGMVEGLGRWLRWTDAIPLAAALQPVTGLRPQPADAAAWTDELARVRTNLERAIRSATAASQAETDFPPWRRRHTAVQQAMETAVAALRGQLRTALALHSAEQARLAALDAVISDALTHREEALLALLPAKLERHFERLRDAAGPDPRQLAWLATYRQDLQQLLQAELELRLQPALGLLAALRDTDLTPA